MGVDKEVLVPDIGEFEDVEVIEVLVAPGDRVALEDSLITIESDKASMEIPSPFAGIVGALNVSVGDRVSEGTAIAIVTVDGDSAAVAAPVSEAAETAPAREAAAPAPVKADAPSPPEQPREAAPPVDERRNRSAHASPAVRRFARELGADLTQVAGTGRKGRILKTDVHAFVKKALAGGPPAKSAGSVVAYEPMRPVDFAKFGEIEIQKLNTVRRVAATSLHRSWVTIPHVTQFDEADITELEEYRKSQKLEGERRGVRLTSLAFLMKALVTVLKEYPQFCASLDDSGENLILKRYYHLGIAVDTPNGLVVPVLRDVDRKGLFELAGELAELGEKARNRKLRPADLQGGCFSISSLGGIGGTAFTPIVNGPEVAILGVSRHAKKPVYIGDELVPRLILPLSLSYDHRVIDGADAARFTTRLKDVLADVRNLLL